MTSPYVLLKRTFLFRIQLIYVITHLQGVWPLWSNLWDPPGADVVCPFQLTELPWSQRIWPWQWQKRAHPTDTATLDVTRPLEIRLDHSHQNLLFWKMHHRVFSECVSPGQGCLAPQDKNKCKTQQSCTADILNNQPDLQIHPGLIPDGIFIRVLTWLGIN